MTNKFTETSSLSFGKYEGILIKDMFDTYGNLIVEYHNYLKWVVDNIPNIEWEDNILNKIKSDVIYPIITLADKFPVGKYKGYIMREGLHDLSFIMSVKYFLNEIPTLTLDNACKKALDKNHTRILEKITGQRNDRYEARKINSEEYYKRKPHKRPSYSIGYNHRADYDNEDYEY